MQYNTISQFTSPSREYKINQEDNEAGIPGILIGDVCSTHSAQNMAYSVLYSEKYITDTARCTIQSAQ